jgi:hypothetical protein
VEINIQRESPRCLRCDEAFGHEQKHHSLLRIEDNDFLREDYCDKCWSERVDAADEDRIYSSWETKYYDSSVARETPQEQFLPLLNLCYESIARGDADGQAMAYMCALILRRQKVFRFVREEREESPPGSVLVLLDKYNDTQIRIVDPQLTESKLRDVKEKLEARLGLEGGRDDDEQAGTA